MRLLALICLGLALSGCTIIKGKDVASGDFPNVAFATLPTNATTHPNAIQKSNCTGTLISPDMVLTAAHCYCPDVKGANPYVVFANNYSAPTVKLEYIKVLASRNMDCGPFGETNTLGVDLAVLRLEKRLNIPPANFATNDEIDNARRFTVVGFGTTDIEGNISSGRKLRADIPAFDNSCSGTTNGKSNSRIYECREGQEIIAGKPANDNTPSAGTCRGDSGGPLFIKRKGPHVAYEYVLAGVTSRGSKPFTYMCGDVAIYVRMTPETKARIFESINELGGLQPAH